MAYNISKTQIDKLGYRLRKGNITEVDLRLLDDYRRSFSKGYEFVVGAVRNELRLEPTGRPAKSTTSISEKLLRESIRLTQIQDIAGCRLIVAGVLEQDDVVNELTNLFSDSVVSDRRTNPSNGYRAVHVIVRIDEHLVEIQVRTSLQHVWAELSEKLSDVFDPAIKYGGGDESLRELLARWSGVVEKEEGVERILARAQRRLGNGILQTGSDRSDETNLSELEADIVKQEKDRVKRRTLNLAAMRRAMENFAKVREQGGKDVIPN
jgi:GTP pyrophosphokinase